MPAVSGSVPVSFNDIFGSVFVPEMWGAVGNGTTDDTNAIQAAINWAASRPAGGEVLFQPKKYLTGSLKIRPKVMLRGMNPMVFSETASANWNTGAVLLLKSGSTSPLIYNNPDDAEGYHRQLGSDGRDQYYISSAIRDLVLDANTINTDSRADAIRIERVWGMEISSCFIRASQKGFAWRILDCNELRYNRNSIIGSVFLESLADCEFSGNQIGGQWGTTNIFWSGVWLSGDTCWKNIFSNNFMFNNTSNMGGYKWTVTASGDTLTTDSTHFFNDRDPIILYSTGTLPGGLTEGHAYYVKKIDDQTIKLSLTRRNVDLGVYITTTNAGTGTHTLQGGRNTNLYLERASSNIFGTNRIDQSYGSGIIFDGAKNNSIYGGTVQENGLGNATPVCGIELINGSTGNAITHAIIDGGTGIGNQTIGIKADATSTYNVISPNNVRGHSTTNVQINGVNSELDSMFFGSDRFEAISGSPVLGLVGGNRRNGWAFDPSSEEIIGTEFFVDPSWGKIRINMYWTNPGAGTGAVVWVANLGQFTVGSSLNAADGISSNVATVTAPAQDVLTKTTLTPDISLSEGRICFLRIKRVSADAGDTLANDATLMYVQIEKVPI